MPSFEQLKARYELLSEKLHQLEMGLIIETQADERFRLQKQIEKAETDLALIVEQFDQEELISAACPYRSLSAFRERDAEFFFGRQDFIQKFVTAVREKPLNAVIGASGSGKSSVIFAGLIPHLRWEQGWIISHFRPKGNPFYELASAVIPLLEPEQTETERLIEVNKKLVPALQKKDISLYSIIDRILAKHTEGKQFLLIADQFEELYINCPKKESECFVETLLEALNYPDTPFKFVLTLRADFFDSILSNRTFADALEDADLKLGPMNQDELRMTIEGPLKQLSKKHQLNIEPEPGLTDRILDDVGSEIGNLPLLEFSLTLLWKKQTDNKLTHTAYQSIGGVQRALTQHAEVIYQNLSDEEKRQLQKIFTYLVQPGEKNIRLLATRDTIGNENWPLVTKLAGEDIRLLVTNRHELSEEVTVEVIHEALIQKWERLQDWINEDREFLMWRKRFNEHLKEWQTGKGSLLHEDALNEARKWQTERIEDLRDDEKQYIANSEKQLTRQSILSKLGQKLTSSIQLSENEILQLIYDDASDLIDVHNMCIALYDELTDTLRFGLVYVNGREITVSDGEEEAGYEPRQIEKENVEQIIKDILPDGLSMPMKRGEKLVGMITTNHPTKDNIYNKDELEILQGMANISAIALENARLYSELEKANRQIAEKQDILTRTLIAGDFVHRFNNIAGAIPIWVDMIRTEISDPTPRTVEITKFLDLIAKDADELIRGLEHWREVSHEINIDIVVLLKNVLRQVRIEFYQEIEQKKFEIITDFQADLYRVRGAATSLSNALYNVIVNGIESILLQETGTLTVQAQNWEDEIDAQWVNIIIADTGSGIAAEYADKIFAPFFSTKGVGRGYGLWRSKTVIEENLQGKMTFSTQIGQGTTFRILLPKTTQEK